MHAKRKINVPRLNFHKYFSAIKFPSLLVLIAFIPRLIVLFGLSDSPIFNHPVIDSEAYHKIAIEIAGGDFIGHTTFWQAPLYSYFLGAIYWLFGVKVIAARIIGMLMGAVNCFLIFKLADNLFSRRVAWIAFITSTLYGPFIFFDAELLAPALLNLLLLISLILLNAYREKPAKNLLILTGLILGLTQIGHGLTIVFLPMIIVWLILFEYRKQNNLKKSILKSGYLLAGFLAIIMITTVRNYMLDDELVFVSSNFGANFYLGNHPNYDSTMAIRPGLEWDEFIGEASLNGFNTLSKSSQYFSQKAFDNITNNFSGMLRLLAKKLYLLTAGEEIKRNLDIYHFKKYSVFLSLLIWKRIIAFPSGLILPLGILGIIFLWGKSNLDKRAGAWPLILLLLSQVIGILLFLVSTRYRLVIMPAIIIFAAYFITRFIDWIQERRIMKLIPAFIILCLLIVFCNVSRVESKPKDHAENLFYESLALSKAGMFEQAVEKIKKALEYSPDYAMAKYNLAKGYDQIGHTDSAASIFDEMVENNQDSYVIQLIVGTGQLERGNFEKAEELFNRVLELNPYSTDAHINLGHIYRTKRDSVKALEHLYKALSINPKSFKAYNQLGAIYYQQNNLTRAEAYITKAYKLNRSYVSAINNLAALYSRTSRMGEAEKLLNKAIILAPDDPNVLLGLGMIRMSKNLPGEALEYFDEAVKVASKVPLTHYYRGLALKSLFRKREALASFKRALKIQPDYEPALEQLKSMGLR